MKKETYEIASSLLLALVIIGAILLFANQFRGYELDESSYGVLFNYLVFEVSPILIIGLIASAIIGASGIEEYLKSFANKLNDKWKKKLLI